MKDIDFEMIKFKPPESGDAPEEVKSILDTVYSKIRSEWSKENPDDIENETNKESASKQAWAAVKNAGWEKDKEGKWNKTEKMEIESVEDLMMLDKATAEIKPTEKEQAIKIFPKGSYYIEKLGKELVFDTTFFTSIQTAFSSPTLSKPFIDKNHEFKDSYGLPIQLLEKNDGLYAKIKLNKNGVELVKNESYRYISPAWGTATDCNGTKFETKLKAISLTNYPALEGALPELQNQIQLSKIDIVKFNEGGSDMELEKLNETLSLSKESSIDLALEKVNSMIKKIGELEAKNNELIKIADDIKLEGLKKEAEEFAKEQITLGKMHPAIQTEEIEDYVLNKEKMISKYNKIPTPEEKKINLDKVTISGMPQIEGINLTSEDLVLMEKIGYDPKSKDDLKQFKIHVIDKRKEINGGK